MPPQQFPLSTDCLLVSDPADLVTELSAATIDPDTIDRIDVKLEGSVVDTIFPGMLVEDTLGLSFDFVETAGQLIIPAGELSGEISVEILGDTDALESNEVVFVDLTAVSGGTFANVATTTRAAIGVLADDAVISWSLIGNNPTVREGSPGAPSTFRLPLRRFGDSRGSDTVEVQVVPSGSNPVEESDFVNGFLLRQVTFAPGEHSKDIEIPITADLDVEGDETFEIRVTDISGSASVVSAPEGFLLTITDDDVQEIQGTSARDTLTGTDARDIITGFRGADTLTGNGGTNIFVYESFQDRGDIITNFSFTNNYISLSQIFASPNYGSTTPFEDYVQLVQVGADTQVHINPVGDARNIFRSLVLLVY